MATSPGQEHLDGDCQSEWLEVTWALKQEILGLHCRAHTGDRMLGACVNHTQQWNQAASLNKTPPEELKP